MKHSSISWMVVLAAICVLVLVPSLAGQIKPDLNTKLDKIEGTVQTINKDTSTITIKQVGSTNIEWQIIYDKDTRFTYRNTASTFAEVKEGRRVICEGKAEKPNKLAASRIDIRDK